MWNHRIFEQIIEDDNDFVGMVAYSIYKQEKIKWIKAQHGKSGTYPTSEEIDQYFHDFASTEGVLKRYRTQAENIVNRFTQVSTFEELTEYKNQIRDEEILNLVEVKLSKSKFRAIVENVVSGLIASGITLLLSIGLYLYQKMEEDKGRNLSDNIPEQVKQHLPQSIDTP